MDLRAGGELQIGTEANPYRHNASITLTDNVKGEDINTMGDRGIMLMRGTLNLHGDREHIWTKLAKTAKAGASSITVLDAKGWRKGDEIVLASTDFGPRQAERRTITAIKGNALTLDKPLAYMHFGEITFGVDERGEVGMLSRNIRIQASEDANQNYFGGHIMAMAGSKMFLDSIELSRMGQHMHLARYPIHWHIAGDGQGQYIRNASIHDTFNRCVTVHGTNNLRIENNVTYNTVGHCFFLEDGIEHGNAFIKNLAIQTKCHPTLDCVPQNLAANGELGYPSADRAAMRKVSFSGKDTLLPSDNTVASYWITNPDNSFIDNVAAVPMRTVSGCLCQNTLKVRSRIRMSARPSGRAERHSAHSEAMWPIPTSTGSCSTGISMKTTPSICPSARLRRWQILLTRTARWWKRTSRI